MLALVILAILLVACSFCDGVELFVLDESVMQNDDVHAKWDIRLNFDTDSKALNELESYNNLIVLKDGEPCFGENGGNSLQSGSVLPSVCRENAKFLSVMLKTTSNDQLTLISSPYYVQSRIDTGKITMVLPLSMSDLTRAKLLFRSLAIALRKEPTVAEILVIVPNAADKAFFANIVETLEITTMTTVTILTDSDILDIPETTLIIWKSLGVYPYAIQMSLKLLVYRFVKTHFYITLDADIVVLNSFTLNDIIIQSSKHSYQSIYINENRYAYHPEWWTGSETFSNISSRHKDTQGIGVTPMILSTYGSSIVVGHILKRYDGTQDRQSQPSLDFMESVDFWQNIMKNYFLKFTCDIQSDECYPNESNIREIESVELFKWLISLGRHGILWSEYTLYRVILDHYEVFANLHRDDRDSDVSIQCHNIWYSGQLPWTPTPQILEDNGKARKCLFSVVQSSAVKSLEGIENTFDEYLQLQS